MRNSGAPAADDGKFQIACGLRLIVLTEPHDGAERCAQLCPALAGPLAMICFGRIITTVLRAYASPSDCHCGGAPG